MIGEKIREIRKNSNLTQKDLAKLSGIAEITIRKYENNERNPKKEQIEKIAKALKVTPFEIMGYDYWDKSKDMKKVLNEVKLLSNIKKEYGDNFVILIETYGLLNEVGRQKALEYISDLSEQNKYQK